MQRIKPKKKFIGTRAVAHLKTLERIIKWEYVSSNTSCNINKH